VYDDAVSREDVGRWESELASLLARIRPLFYRAESKKHAEQYVRGLLSPLERKNGWTIAEHVGELEPAALQRFLNLSPWDADTLVEHNREYAMEHLADRRGSSWRIRQDLLRRAPNAELGIRCLMPTAGLCRVRGEGAGQRWLRRVGDRHNPGL
jgi:hypothetical protein